MSIKYEVVDGRCITSGTIANIHDLCACFGADEPDGLNHRIYKNTACGASISIHLEDGRAFHNGQEWPSAEDIHKVGVRGFTIQTIVEGSDATVDSDMFELPVNVRDIDEWIEYMEAEADALWHEANDDEEDGEAAS